MNIYKVFCEEKTMYWDGVGLYLDQRGKTFDTLTEVLDSLEYTKNGSSWAMHKPQEIPSSWIIIEYEIKEHRRYKAKEYAEAR